MINLLTIRVQNFVKLHCLLKRFIRKRKVVPFFCVMVCIRYVCARWVRDRLTASLSRGTVPVKPRGYVAVALPAAPRRWTRRSSCCVGHWWTRCVRSSDWRVSWNRPMRWYISSSSTTSSCTGSGALSCTCPPMLPHSDTMLWHHRSPVTPSSDNFNHQLTQSHLRDSSRGTSANKNSWTWASCYCC